MATPWRKQLGNGMANTWQSHVKSMAVAWQEHDENMAQIMGRGKPDVGRTRPHRKRSRNAIAMLLPNSCHAHDGLLPCS
eukprot:5017563-Lingulodinium_polyedra.AAC.1